jgi:2-methylfumaryl-CoA hydratase
LTFASFKFYDALQQVEKFFDMKPRTAQGYFFDDFELGAVLKHPTPRTITAGDQSLYTALTGSRFAHHSSAPLSKAMGYADSPLDDLLVFHIAFGKTVPDVSLNAVANLGYADVRFLAPVYAGDTLSVRSEVIGLKGNSNGKTGVVYVRSTADVHRGPVTNAGGSTVAISWVRWVMVNRAPAMHGQPFAAEQVPSLPAVVEPAQLAIPKQLNIKALSEAATGSQKRFDDFDDGEVIDHPSGLTIDNAEHTLATKLYQNNARVHFDAHAMKSSRFGQRLVYGGHIISLARALSHDGLENAFAIAAINAGSHTAPCFAGDTIYCRSIVLERWLLPDQSNLGAMRLRLLAFKNATPAEGPYTATAKDDERIVLDLDFTVLIPR